MKYFHSAHISKRITPRDSSYNDSTLPLPTTAQQRNNILNTNGELNIEYFADNSRSWLNHDELLVLKP